jgi:hypothetical protein
MKTITLIIVLYFLTFSTSAQIVDVNSGVTVMDAPSGSYISDLNDTFTPFLGTWKYQNGNAILIVVLEKVTQHYYPEFGNYKDFIKGNYSYSTNGGLTYITNTIFTNLSVDNPNSNSFYSPGPGSDNLDELDMSFKDAIYNKSCDAIFKFVTGSTTQMTMKLSNRFRGYILPETPPNPDFSIPNNVTLIKE